MKSIIKKGGLPKGFLIGKKMDASKKEDLEAILFITALLLSLPTITGLLLLFLN